MQEDIGKLPYNWAGRASLMTSSSEWQGLVPGAGLEPACLTARDFKSLASTNFATRAGSSLDRPDAALFLPKRILDDHLE